MLTITRIDELTERAGTELGASEWVAVTQEPVDAFAAATGDHQWIHTDPERAADSPFGGTIAHGYYALALAPLAKVLSLDGFAMTVNYGLDRLRFPAPLPTGEQVRMRRRPRCGRAPTGRRRALPEPDVRARGGRQASVRRERRLPRLRAEVI
jgi:acyl dehydratase